MNKKICFCILSAVFIILSLCICFGAEVEAEVSADAAELKSGDEISVDFNITKNAGFNNFTFFVDYDPEIIMASEFTSEDDISDWLKVSDSSTDTVITKELINKQMEVVPSADDEDYSDLGADGAKTAAELGRIKLSGRIYTSSGLGTVSETGKFFSINFTAMSKSGTSEITITPVNSGFAPLPSVGGELTSLFTSASVTVKNYEQAEVNGATYVIDTLTGEIISVETSESDIIVPDIINQTTVTALGERAFAGCSTIVNLYLPNGITKIDSYCFEGLDEMVYISIPETVEEIEIYAFKGCSKLESIVLPYGVKLGVGAFADCSSLKSVRFSES